MFGYLLCNYFVAIRNIDLNKPLRHKSRLAVLFETVNTVHWVDDTNSSISTIIIATIFFTTDIDECVANTDDCSQLCSNNDGSFTCGCNPGYTLDTDGVTCSGKISEITLLNTLAICSACVIELICKQGTPLIKYISSSSNSISMMGTATTILCDFIYVQILMSVWQTQMAALNCATTMLGVSLVTVTLATL